MNGPHAPTTDPSRWWPKWWLVSLALVVVAGAAITFGLTPYRHPLAPPVPQSVRTAAPNSTPILAQTASQRTVLGRSTPVSITIAAISVTSTVSQLGLTPYGTVAVPTDFAQPGWFEPGPSPGQVGSAVILGHVDNTEGPAVFFNLRTLVPGDQIEVALADGVTTDFAVTSVAMYAKANFPAAAVYGPSGGESLRLVTCGGVFDPAIGSYLSNIVVSSTLVSATLANGTVEKFTN